MRPRESRAAVACGLLLLILPWVGLALLLTSSASAQRTAPAGAPAAAATVADAAASSAGVLGVDAIGTTVSDLDRALGFYTGVLGFRKVAEREVHGDAAERLAGVFGVRARIARLALGDEYLELTEYLAPEGRPMPADSRSDDLWFQHVAIVVSDLERAYRHLRAHRVRHASAGPQRLPDWNPNAGGIEAFYFKDPDGHVLELIAFPPGKGDARWQRDDALFLGIDHTAITVADTEQSLRFWRDTLGLVVAGGSENWGIEQERLNNVFGARLRITTLRGDHGPGVELLEYLAPEGGRSAPGDTRSNDLWHWHTTLAIASAEHAARALHEARARLVSPGVVKAVAGDGDVVLDAIALRDPDGHGVQLVARAR